MNLTQFIIVFGCGVAAGFGMACRAFMYSLRRIAYSTGYYATRNRRLIIDFFQDRECEDATQKKV